MSLKNCPFNKREVLATRLLFLCAGLATATWASLIPIIKAHVGIDESTLGFLLLCLGAGAIFAMPISGALAIKYGCKRILQASAILIVVCLPFFALVNSVVSLAVLLVIFGLSIGTTDCVMNIQAVLVEERSKMSLMSGFHGFYSLGGIVGAGAVAVLLIAAFSAFEICLAMALVVLLCLLIARGDLLPFASQTEGPAFALPKGPVVLIGVICFAMFLAEGTVLDWSGIYLMDYQNASTGMAALGIFSFSITMTLGRLFGDRIITHFGQRVVLTISGLTASLGLLIAIAPMNFYLALFGYVLMGIGCANVVPIMFSAAGKQTYMSQATAIPAVTTLGYVGVLMGPASVGQIAHFTSLAAALVVIAILIAIATMLSFFVKVTRV
ncbi:MFS transporter [Pseudoalteromonas sp. HM-SA03]|uniref:MFS transporter n=1 Tax=Pseudoalteromonas sp. HM-SA03 TaxID=2029678 RepID=UPI000BADDE18|nr:MFS transporter [Pseudoalteromonas sp. HM-SA03]PAY01988.1 MFS transporter [Pseudoalteromonas sp. HM-SA03]